jgi:murein DD-endopeptidase MepM/ murein hydrolase activator NlpD
MHESLTAAIESEQNVAPLFSNTYIQTPPLHFDFSRNNPDIQTVDMMDAASLQSYVRTTLEEAGRSWGLGGYGEDRFFYQSSDLFKHGNEYRTIHLGVDIWLPAGTPLFAPLDAVVHSFHNNDHFLDYGPTIILQHSIQGTTFYTLYGHLAASSLDGLSVGKKIAHAEQIATVGQVTENGSWAPHLHLQMMTDLLGKTGDFPGTAAPSEKDSYLNICPDPMMLLKRFLI